MSSSLVLVIEDHLLRRTNAAETLRDAGYDVIEEIDAAMTPVASGDGAAAPLCGAAVQMPAVRDGVDLALLIRRMYPHIHVILSSAVFGRGAPGGYVRFTPKPLNGGRIGFAHNGPGEPQRVVH